MRPNIHKLESLITAWPAIFTKDYFIIGLRPAGPAIQIDYEKVFLDRAAAISPEVAF